MPSHIYIRLGLWREAMTSDEALANYRASEARQPNRARSRRGTERAMAAAGSEG
jgi:hypothetical protein